MPRWQLEWHLGVQDILIKATALVGITARPNRPPFLLVSFRCADPRRHQGEESCCPVTRVRVAFLPVLLLRHARRAGPPAAGGGRATAAAAAAAAAGRPPLADRAPARRQWGSVMAVAAARAQPVGTRCRLRGRPCRQRWWRRRRWRRRRRRPTPRPCLPPPKRSPHALVAEKAATKAQPQDRGR